MNVLRARVEGGSLLDLPGPPKTRASGGIVNVHIVVPANPHPAPTVLVVADGHRVGQLQVATRPCHVVEDVQDHFVQQAVLDKVARLQEVVERVIVARSIARRTKDQQDPGFGVVVEGDVVLVEHVGSRDEVAAPGTLAS